MSALPVIAIFDVGKTNKKLFLFDQNYKIVFERSARFTETVDEDGDACENLESLRLSVFDSLREVFSIKDFEVKAINFSTYGASFVHVDEEGMAVTPLYNYLKPYPEELKKQFYDTYGGEERFSNETASPVLGHLNSGMQIYWLKYRKPQLYKKIKYSLHLPQYMSYLVSGNYYSDITSIGCHTNLWDFNKNDYHQWVYKEGIIEKLAPIVPGDHIVPAAFEGTKYLAGIGLHDSSAALIPYLVNFHEPFVLISTGTWCISLNPFNDTLLTVDELKQDCLSFLHYQGKPVKAARLFAGNEHEQQVKRIGEHFNQHAAKYRNLEFNAETIALLRQRDKLGGAVTDNKNVIKTSLFDQRDMSDFVNDEEAYHQLMLDIVTQQYASTELVLKGTDAKRIFVDGGFSKNAIYMNLLSSFFSNLEVFAATVAQATAVGSALAIHNAWNKKTLPNDLIELKFFSTTNPVTL
ncbi:MAG: carbohydrate kinase [Segetibacter sp.]|nr:carbohydrate kinase [Segetibacter sp.]